MVMLLCKFFLGLLMSLDIFISLPLLPWIIEVDNILILVIWLFRMLIFSYDLKWINMIGLNSPYIIPHIFPNMFLCGNCFLISFPLMTYCGVNDVTWLVCVVYIKKLRNSCIVFSALANFPIVFGFGLVL